MAAVRFTRPPLTRNGNRVGAMNPRDDMIIIGAGRLFVAQGVDRMQRGGPRRRVDTKEQAN